MLNVKAKRMAKKTTTCTMGLISIKNNFACEHTFCTFLCIVVVERLQCETF